MELGAHFDRHVQKLRHHLIERPMSYLKYHLINRVRRRKCRYRLHYPTNLDRLRGILQPGDVLLVEGDAELSNLIKLYSVNTWTHCALYVGPGIRVRDNIDPKFAEPGGDLCEALIGEGVVLQRLDKYKDNNLRICRPAFLEPHKLQQVVNFVVDKIGWGYDDDNVFNYLRLPFSEGIDPQAPIGDQKLCRFTCASLLSIAFGLVGHDVIQYYDKQKDRLFPYHPSQVQPKDFDLSPNFDIIKHEIASRKEQSLMLARAS